MIKDAFKWGIQGITLALGLQMFWMQNAKAIGDFGPAAVLPAGRYQAAFRMGMVSDIQDKFSNDGQLNSLSRLNQRMDNNFLRKNADFKNLANLMNSQNPLLHLGDKLDPGAVEATGRAQVNYMSPQLARGITSRWTIGIAVPIVNYKSQIQLSNVGTSNVPAIFKQLGDTESLGKVVGGANGQRTLEAMKNGPTALIREMNDQAGNKPLDRRDETFLGDVYLASVFQLHQSPHWSIFAVNLLELPTGPKPDPDDLMTIPVFGRTALQNTLANNFYLNSWLTLGLGMTYTYRFADDVTLRVPRNENDMIPPANTKEHLNRDLGDTIGFDLASMFSLTDDFSVGLGYEMQFKGMDHYKGDQGSRYDLLQKNTEQQASFAKFKMSYSTITSFLGGRSKVPYTISYALTDLFAGVNAEHQVTNELIMALYF